MSIIYSTSPKHCAAKNGGSLLHLKKLDKKLIFSLSTFFFSIIFIILLIWIIYHPSKPQFYLQDVSVDDFRFSPPPFPRLLNSTIQATIFSKNPNARVGIYYDRLHSWAVYKDQQITAKAQLPRFYQGHGDTNILSVLLSGTAMPVAQTVGYEVGRDQIAGKVLIRLRLNGQLRWKVASWVSGWYRFDVDCVAVVSYGAGGTGSWIPAAEMESLEGRRCSSNV